MNQMPRALLPNIAEPRPAADDRTQFPQITILTKRDTPDHMSKRITLADDGTVKSDGSECRMITGTAAAVSASTASELARIIQNCGSNQAIALGALAKEIASPVTVTTKERVAHNPGSIARSRGYIDYQPGCPAWALIDFDSKSMPDEIKNKVDTAGGMWNALVTVVPELATAARVSRASTSAGLFCSDKGKPIAGSNGMHHYVLVRDGGDVERFLKKLHERCWLLGYGWHMIGGAGQLLDRSIVDRMVGYGERLCFEGEPITVAPIAQDQAKRVPEAIEGEAIDSTVAVPRLTEFERQRVNEAKAASAKALGKTAARIREKHDGELAKKLSGKSGTPIATARRLVKARHQGVLYSDVELQFDYLDGLVTVGAVMADPERYVDETLADPMEGIDYGRGKAKLMRGSDGDLFIHSFAHGQAFYRLRHDLKSAKAALERIEDASVDGAMAIFAQSDLEEDEEDQFAKFVANYTKASIRAVRARIKKMRAERRARAREASMEAKADGRIILARPEPYGELTPIVSLLDEVLVNDGGQEPPMRNASGALVRVEEKEPWALHLLTSETANAAEEQAENMNPPTELVLVALTPTGVELLIERYVGWIAEKKDGSTYFASLPGAYTVALMEHPSSAVPVVRAINTCPLITASAGLIDGAGLDRATGLFHRIDPVLRNCVPQNKPTDEEIKTALRFLLDEWLVDVALDALGKCVAIMLALTLLERALLAERPAFFVTAGQRGGGKTTLVSMIIAAILGRRPAAAAWSDNAEERKKALFSYLRQGLAALIWDNISRGAAISCPHIEAALTAPEISDRVLGVSQVETVPATTVQMFTGNSIMPRGDMASRSFVLSLDVNRPDPENRSFTHSDPLAWTQANRTKILSALYVILVGGILQRPQGQIAKTRFKAWWRLIGWPVEYAAKLLDIKLDCTELLRLGESEDEEASATCRALSALHREWSGRWFTTRQVVLFLNERVSLVDENKAARAEALFDSLSDLIGKPIENPTARSLGKLFQKHLTNRPALIGDENRAAVLRKVAPDKNKDGNRYEVVVLQSESSSGDQ